MDEQKTQLQPPTPPIAPKPPVPPTAPSITVSPIPASPTNLSNQTIQSPAIPPPKPPINPVMPATPKTTLPPEKPISTTMDFSEKDVAAEVIKYSIRTMAQDLERAQKEGVSAGVKLPSAPPPPPTPKISPLKAMPVAPAAPAPMPPKPVTPTISAIPTPTPVKPIPPISEAPRPIPTPQPTIKPLPPTEPSIVPPTLKPSRLSFSHLNLIIGIIAAIVLLSGSIGFSYWWFFAREAAPTSPVVEEPIPEEKIPEIAEPELPKKIISTDRDVVVDVDTRIPSSLTTSKITTQLSSKTFDLNSKELGRILIKYSTDKEKAYLSFNQSLSMLGLAIPQNVSSEISDGEILVYSQNGKMRYGFVAKISGGLQTLDAMNSWEATMVNDIQPLLIDAMPTKPQDGVFRDNFYESFIKSYYNFIESDTSIDWGVSDDKKLLVVATSKDMIYEIIDSIPVISQ